MHCQRIRGVQPRTVRCHTHQSWRTEEACTLLTRRCECLNRATRRWRMSMEYIRNNTKGAGPSCARGYTSVAKTSDFVYVGFGFGLNWNIQGTSITFEHLDTGKVEKSTLCKSRRLIVLDYSKLCRGGKSGQILKRSAINASIATLHICPALPRGTKTALPGYVLTP